METACLEKSVHGEKKNVRVSDKLQTLECVLHAGVHEASWIKLDYDKVHKLRNPNEELF